MKSNIFYFTLLFYCLSCKKNTSEVPNKVSDSKEDFIIFDYSVEGLNIDNDFLNYKITEDTLKIPLLSEASGLAVSRSDPNFFWSHNDSGNPNWLFPVHISGLNYGYAQLTGAGARDYEDICIGRGPELGVNYIYIGDIGDNQSQYPYIIIYRIPEPDLQNINPQSNISFDSQKLERFEFEYPDGPIDSETLMIDPWTGDLYIITKRGYRSIVYRAKYPLDSSKKSKLEKLAQFPFNWAVAGDISQDGKQIAVKTPQRIYYWKRNVGQTIVEALSVQPKLLPYIEEPKGESFGWTPGGNGYFTLSEQNGAAPPIIYFYSQK